MSEVTDSTLAAEAEDVDLLGPVDWIVVEFPGSRFDGTIFPILLDLEAQGTIRVLDLVVLKKDAEGTLEAFELSDLEDSEIGGLRDTERQLATLLSEDDVLNVANAIEPGSAAALLVWENSWAAPFASAVRKAGGQLVASGRIPVQALLAALEADTADAARKLTRKEPEMGLARRRMVGPGVGRAGPRRTRGGCGGDGRRRLQSDRPPAGPPRGSPPLTRSREAYSSTKEEAGQPPPSAAQSRA